MRSSTATIRDSIPKSFPYTRFAGCGACGSRAIRSRGTCTKSRKPVYSSDSEDPLANLGTPARYADAEYDCFKFHSLYEEGFASIRTSTASRIFDLSTIFLAIRNFATCYRLGIDGVMDFSRDAATHMGEISVPLSKETYEVLGERERMLATRGAGRFIAEDESADVLDELPLADGWMRRLRDVHLDRPEFNNRVNIQREFVRL